MRLERIGCPLFYTFYYGWLTMNNTVFVFAKNRFFSAASFDDDDFDDDFGDDDDFDDDFGDDDDFDYDEDE